MTSPISEGVRPIRLAAAGIALIAVSYGLARFAYGLFVPAFRETFDLDATAAGSIAAGSYVAYCIGVLVATTATPRFGARLVAVTAGSLATVGTGVIALAPDAIFLSVGVVVAGASTGVASPPLVHAIAHTVAGADRDRTQTVVNSGTGLGVMVSGPVALLVHDEWRIAWLVFAGIAAAVTLGCLFAVPTARGEKSASERSSHRLWPPGATGLLGA